MACLYQNKTLYNKDQLEKETGHVRLINGMILPLDDKPIMHKDPSKINSTAMQVKVKRENQRIQSYYDVVKNHIKTKSK